MPQGSAMVQDVPSDAVSHTALALGPRAFADGTAWSVSRCPDRLPSPLTRRRHPVTLLGEFAT